MCALSIIFNNGMEAPEKFSYPETAAGGSIHHQVCSRRDRSNISGRQPATEPETIEIKLTIGEAEIIVNGEAKALDVPGQIVDSRTLVPVRAIAESFGCEVGWDDPTKTVTING